MKLLILADLHKEFESFDRTDTEADVVILAGDTDTATKGIEWAKTAFAGRPVLYVPGNHEYYGCCYQKHREKMREAAAGSNVVLLDRDRCEIGDVVFLGATLWADFNLLGNQPLAMLTAQGVMNDFRHIRTMPDYRKFQPADAARIHAEERAWLEKELEAAAGRKVVVITHNLPSMRSVPERYRTDPISAAYASNLDDLVERSGALLWLHGHTHTASDYIIGQTRVLCNPRGYFQESPRQTGFKFDLVVNIEAEPGELRITGPADPVPDIPIPTETEDDKIRAWSLLISELSGEDREPFRRHMMETAPRACPAPLPGDVAGDLRVWRQDYERWKNGMYGIEFGQE